MNDDLSDELEIFGETLDDLKSDIGEKLLASITDFDDCLNLDDYAWELQEEAFELAREKASNVDEYLELATAMNDYNSNQYSEQIKQLCKMASDEADSDDEEQLAEIKETIEELNL